MAIKDEKLMNHEYDGIQELDNDMPSWWLWLFYISIFWSVIYMLHYHVLGTGDLQIAEYQKEFDANWTAEQDGRQTGSGLTYHSPFYNSAGDVTPREERERILADLREAELIAKRAGIITEGKSAAVLDVSTLSFDELLKAAMTKAEPEDLEKLKNTFPEIYANHSEDPGATSAEDTPIAAINYEALTDAASLEAGKNIFLKNCASCHGNLGEGGIGPNMTDDYWIHGAGMGNFVNIINVGVPAKGMISWKPILNEKEILQVSSYILTLHGTNPPKGKKPQGEKVEYPL